MSADEKVFDTWVELQRAMRDYAQAMVDAGMNLSADVNDAEDNIILAARAICDRVHDVNRFS